jgi:hypothetical protein
VVVVAAVAVAGRLNGFGESHDDRLAREMLTWLGDTDGDRAISLSDLVEAAASHSDEDDSPDCGSGLFD